MANDILLEDLARAVLDGNPVDWANAESRADADTTPVVRMFKALAAVAQVHRDPDEAAATWGHLRILERIGRGAFGEVYRAWDTRLDREVALKLLPADPQSVDGTASSIIREGRLLARVHHPNVVTIHGAEQIGGRIGLWMEFVRGRTLEDLLESKTSFTAAEVIHIGVELSRAVHAVHAAGLLHRDIKAHNVMRADDGRVVLMDFGTGRELTDTGSDLTGTPLYLAPEVFAGQPATVQSDVYSLGVLLFRLVTGTYPVRGRSIRDLRSAHERGERLVIRDVQPSVPKRLVRVIEQAVDPDPLRRQQSAAELGAALAALQRGRASQPLLHGAGAIAVLTIAGAIVWRGLPLIRFPAEPSQVPATAASPPALDEPSPSTGSRVIESVSQEPATEASATSATPGQATTVSPQTPTADTAPPQPIQPGRPAGVRPSIQVLPFTNAIGRGGDAWLSATVAELLLREFRGSEAFRWIPGAVALAKAQLGQALITEGSQSIRPIVPADIVVSGEFRVTGSPAAINAINLVVRIEDMALGRPPATLTETGTTADLVGLVSRLGIKARAALGVPALSLEQTRALAASQPANTEAARAYSEGLSRLASEAVEFNERAIAADSRFAPAYAALAEGLIFRNEPDRAREIAARAAPLAADFPREERMLIEVRSLVVAGGSKTVEAREQIFGELFRLFPDTMLYGFETARAQLRTREHLEGLATIDSMSRLPGATENVGLIQLEGRLARAAGDRQREQKALEQAAAIAIAVDDRSLLGFIRVDQARLLQDRGDLPAALAIAEEALQHFGGKGAGADLDTARGVIVQIARAQGDFARARTNQEEIIASQKDRSPGPAQAGGRWNLADLLAHQGQLAESRSVLERLRDDWRSDPRLFFMQAQMDLGVVLLRQGELAAAQGIFEEGLAHPLKPQMPDCELLQRLARVLFQRGDVARAREHAKRSLEIRDRSRVSDETVASTLSVLARTQLAADDPAGARQSLSDAAPLARLTGYSRRGAFDVAMVRALLSLDERRLDESRARAEEALALARADFRPDDTAEAESMLAVVRLAEGNPGEAQRAIARAEPRLKTTQDRLLRLSAGIRAASVRGASASGTARARGELEAIAREATEIGAVAIAFDARLALGEIEIRSGDISSGQARLTALQREALARGFNSIVRKAGAAAK